MEVQFNNSNNNSSNNLINNLSNEMFSNNSIGDLSNSSQSPSSSTSSSPSSSSPIDSTFEYNWKLDDYPFVQPSLRLMSGGHVYPMTANPRGFCLIINNVDFVDNDNWPKRIGSDEEARRLASVFTQLYFQVIHRRNLNHAEMIATMLALAAHPELSSHDALVVIILSHGSSGAIFGTDNRPVPFEAVLSIFNNRNCPSLIAKPKMFFFNCCRGSAQDFGPGPDAVCRQMRHHCPGQLNSSPTGHYLTSLSNVISGYDELSSSGEDVDVADAAPCPQVPIVSDMMICFSTIDGYVSWRNETHGTWFGSALSKALAQHSCHCELNQILTIAASLVQRRMTRQGAKQAIEWKYRAWTKSLYFNPSWTRPK